MDTKLLSYATRSVPRYTSYPTAPHFTDAVTDDQYRAWLGALTGETELSLYLHVPFCRSICRYCGCNTKASRRDEPIYDYANVLVREIEMLADSLTSARTIAHIAWGGGTPSLLPADAFIRIVETIKAHFTLSETIEHAMELDPRTVTADMAHLLASCGVNRVSLGVQDFTPKVQEAIGRIQPFSVVAEATGHLRDAGITAINFDLMYGLPHQTCADVINSTDLSADLKPSRVALFGYAHVPWFKKHQTLIKEEWLPGTEERLDQAEASRQRLLELGYEAIGLDHFALPDDPMAIAAREGALKRNFQGYTTDKASALIGLGASSIGKLPQGYLQNAPDLGGYKRKVMEEGVFPIARSKVLNADDCVRSDLIETLMSHLWVDVAAIAAAHDMPASMFDDDLTELDDLIRDGLVIRDGYRISIPETGRAFVRLAASAFDAYLKTEKAKHSVAV